MTLCIAAKCKDNGQSRIVTCADRRVETDYAGADIAIKYERLTNDWVALYADDPGSVYEFAQVCRQRLEKAEREGNLNPSTILDHLDEAISKL